MSKDKIDVLGVVREHLDAKAVETLRDIGTEEAHIADSDTKEEVEIFTKRKKEHLEQLRLVRGLQDVFYRIF